MGGPREIAAALQADQYHVLHLSAHGSASGVELEDEDGNPVAVSASALVGQLRAGGRPLPLIVLSSCAGGAGGSSGLAATLVRHGADRVVAMQASVSDMYATTLARVANTDALSATIVRALAIAENQARGWMDREPATDMPMPTFYHRPSCP
ncbi:MAG: CHAT domain-containing protein, partial [Solirubrobacteraceae bacterium]